MRKQKNKSGPLAEQLPKLCGADIELGNFILGGRAEGGTGSEASRAVLAEIEGLPRAERYQSMACDCDACRRKRNGNGTVSSVSAIDPQDWGRKYLPANGGCAYIDLDHLELCLPEVLSAYDHVACWHAMLRLARRALESANEKLPPGKRIQVLVNNSDGQGNSYGSHLNFLITRRAWDNIFRRRLHYMLYLAAFQASSIVYTGQGKVSSENDMPDVQFQISQRADFFETLVGLQTTHRRPIVNSRDESLCGNQRIQGDDAAGQMARLHVIFFDSNLCHVASLLKVGVMQMVVAMIEAERVNPNLLLDDAVDAVRLWSHDPALRARARLATGRRTTALELQLRFLEEARRFSARGGFECIVPRAGEILGLWEDTLQKLEAADYQSLASRLDWVLKQSILAHVLQSRPGLDWDAPQIKHLDHLYASLDAEQGLYWAYESKGLVETVVSESEIERFTMSPPEDTRAWTRAMLLRWAGEEAVDDVNWDRIRFRMRGAGSRSPYRRLDMPNPLAFTKRDTQGLFDAAATLDDLLDDFGARPGESAESQPIKHKRRKEEASL